MSEQVRRRSVYADRLLEFPDIVFSDGREFQNRGRWRELFGTDNLIFEIGCNDAALLASVAAKHPSVGFVGIDWKCRALHTAAERISAAGLKNVALLHGRAQHIRRIFSDGELDEVWVFHPEPCDTPRELPNRLLAKSFLLDVHAVLRDETSLLVVKTDHAEYFRWVESQAQQLSSDLAIGVRSEDYWADESLRDAGERLFATEPTFFERRFMKKRQPIYYLELKKHQPACS